jgi:predicted RNase H-like nuclease (RuvC/YqgF family)
MRTYRCPVCKKPLTKEEYEQALGILGERERHLQHERAKLLEQVREWKARAKTALMEGKEEERKRTQRLLAGKDKTIQALKERIEQLQRGSTPQTEGLEFEEKLAARLRREFPEDDVRHKGRGSDVLHIGRSNGKVAGTIIYECKRTSTIQGKHVQQAYLAKQSREADFAVLVTTGQRKGFSGLAQLKGFLSSRLSVLFILRPFSGFT